MTTDIVIPSTPLKNAPIVEALLDLQIKSDTIPGSKVFEEFHSTISTYYPKRFERRSIRAGFQFSQTELPKVINTHNIANGFRYHSIDDKNIVEIENGEFTFHRLKPYEGWDQFLPEFTRWWKVYQEIFGPARITRIGLRFINRIELPFPIHDFNDYILTGPQVAQKLPQGIMELFMRLVIPKVEQEIMGIVTQAMAPIENNKLPLIFDIDTFKIVNIASTDMSIWEIIKNLRIYKNDIFFGSMTTKAIDLFQ